MLAGPKIAPEQEDVCDVDERVRLRPAFSPPDDADVALLEPSDTSPASLPGPIASRPSQGVLM